MRNRPPSEVAEPRNSGQFARGRHRELRCSGRSCSPNAGQRGLDLWLAERGQPGASGPVRRYRGETPLDVAAKLLDVHGHHRLDGGPLCRVQAAVVAKVVGQWPRPVASPRGKGRKQPSLIDHACSAELRGRRAGRAMRRSFRTWSYLAIDRGRKGTARPDSHPAEAIVDTNRNPTQQTERLGVGRSELDTVRRPAGRGRRWRRWSSILKSARQWKEPLLDQDHDSRRARRLRRAEATGRLPIAPSVEPDSDSDLQSTRPRPDTSGL